jgi:Dyp-type peroxidase family
MMRAEVDYADVQGLVRFGYGKMTEAVYVLVQIKNASAARTWLRTAPISNAVALPAAPPTALQIAFTASGLAALGVSGSVIAGFSREFFDGMTEQNRLRRSGDVGANAPARWDWGADGSNGAAGVPHAVVMFFAERGAEGGGGVAAFMRRLMDPSWTEAFDVLRTLKTANLDGVEPFGFADGISQPEVDWNRQREAAQKQIGYINGIALGEVLLGYPNEYGKYTERPLLDADVASEMLLPAEDAPSKRDLARNGTYLVMRQLRQDVRGFWQFIARESSGNPHNAEQLASAFVGRTMSGDPLVPASNRSSSAAGGKSDQRNQFTFDGDPAGAQCPFGAHIRRVNPRNGDFPGRPRGIALLLAMLGLNRREFRDDLTSSVRFHRIVRRGREYGPGLTPEEALAPAPTDDPERGLHFLCLNANISRQFEFLQNAWVMNTKFSALTGASDPLLGNREPIPGCPATDDFILERRGSARRRVSGLPQFITVRGGAYFFLPSLRAIQYIAAG